MRIFINILFCSCFAVSTLAQNPAIYDQMHFGGTGDDVLEIYQSPNDDGFYLIGSSDSNISGNKTENSKGGDDIWIIKTDENFNILWDKTIGGSEYDWLNDVIFEGNYLYLLSVSGSNASGDKTMDLFETTRSDLWFLCLDLNGNIQWQTQYGGTHDERIGTMIDFTDSTFLISCSSLSQISGNKTVNTYNNSDDIWLLEVKKNDGTILQQRGLGTDGYEDIPRVRKTQTNRIFIACHNAFGINGDKTDPGYGGEDIWLIELDQNLNIIQDKCFGGSGAEQFGNLSEVNGNLYLSSNSTSEPSGNKTAPNYNTFSSVFDAWLVKLDENLNIVWDMSYGGSNHDYGGKVISNINGRILYNASSKSFINTGNKTAIHYGDTDAWLLILNPTDGSIIAQETYGGTNGEGGSAMNFLNSNNQLLFRSNTTSGISGNKTVPTYGGTDLWLAKLDASDFLNTTELSGSKSAISVYPNPFAEHINFKFTNLEENVQIRLINVSGQILDELSVFAGTTHFEWKSAVNENIIFYEIVGAGVNHKGKLVRL